MSTFGISSEKFYGRKSGRQEKIEAIIKKQNEVFIYNTPKFMNQLLGPSRTWKVFNKQIDAINCSLQRRNGLMCFAFEDIHFRRMFLVAHPKVFWSFNHHRFFKNCNSYEIIREYAACKLYLDIEYEFAYNKYRNKERMLDNLLKIINFNLSYFFKIECSREDILDLDSSSLCKFSRHIIYQIKNTAFQDNYMVGNFIKHICDELKQAYETNSKGDGSKLCELSAKYQLDAANILELFIFNEKKKVKLLVDEGVYTKNRHFRILGSSKQSKNIPLVPSEVNTYKPSNLNDLLECSFFIDSLVTCFSWEIKRVLEFEKPELKNMCNSSQFNIVKKKPDCESNSTLYPKVDLFINRLIAPNGRIRRKMFFSDSSTLVYEIQGFRYCDNIKREHKSNNILYIVDLQCLGYYQKCYDPDCSDFRSNIKPLPEEIKFLFDDDSVFDSIENGQVRHDFEMESDVTDEELGKVVDCVEALLDVKW